MSRPSRQPRRVIGSWPGGWLIRRVTMDDVRKLNGSGIDPAYCIGEPVGYAAERNGHLLAAGSITWDRYGAAWAWLDVKKAMPARRLIPAATLHRCALEMLAMLQAVGEPELFMICNLAIPGAEKWILRLGFKRDETLTHPLGPVYKCALST